MTYSTDIIIRRLYERAASGDNTATKLILNLLGVSTENEPLTEGQIIAIVRDCIQSGFSEKISPEVSHDNADSST